MLVLKEIANLSSLLEYTLNRPFFGLSVILPKNSDGIIPSACCTGSHTLTVKRSEPISAWKKGVNPQTLA